jgi:spermidine synthase
MLPMALHQAYPQAQVDVVEIDPAVLDVAERYFDFVPDAQVHPYVGDGRMFVRKQGRAGVKYDVIMIDAFDKDYIPEHMLTVEFLSQVGAILAPHGVVAANTFIGPLTPYETATYQAAFQSVCAVDVRGGNRIILAVRDGHLDLGAMASTARSLDSVLAPSGVSSSLLVPEMKDLPRLADIHPLTDQFSPANLLLKYEH